MTFMWQSSLQRKPQRFFSPSRRQRASFLSFLILICGCFGVSDLAHSDMLKMLGIKNQRKLVMQVHQEAVNKEVVNVIAKVGEPSTGVAKIGQTVGQLIESRCGYVSDDYIALLRQSGVPGLPKDFGLETKFQADEEVELPACIRSNAVTVSAGDTKAWSEITLKDPDQRLQTETELRNLLQKSGQDELVVEDPEEIHLYSELSKEELDSSGACQSPRNASGALMPETPPYNALEVPYNALEVLRVLTRDLSMLPSTQRGTPVTIVLPDTGLFFNGRSPFPNDRVDTMGATGNFHDALEGIKPYAGQRHNQHGTYVASVALGGEQMMQILDTLDLKIRLAPINMLSEKEKTCAGRADLKCPDVRADVFNNAVDFADNANAIVNLSVGRGKPFSEIDRALGRGSDVLFVVAAGNDQESLERRPTYPASYGGQGLGSQNLITVAATDLEGKRAKFSNYGDQYVDIAAPGCMQKVISFDEESQGFRFVQASGTSFAAPLVSFTAALLRTVWPNTNPRSVKKRILVGADISPLLLPDEVAHSRKLNVAKTLTLYEDVVDARIDGRLLRVRGRIDDEQRLFDFCENISLHRERGARRNVIKKIAAITKPESQLLVDWEDYDGLLKTKVCPPQKFSIGITDSFTHRHYKLESESIVDVVFAELRQR